MFQNIGIPGLILILVLALIIFGPQKLPLLGRAVGQTFREFRKTASEISEDVSVTENLETKTIQVDEFKSR